MYKIIVILIFNSALVSNSLVIKEYLQPVATSYATREDGDNRGKGFGYDVSKKYGYDNMILTTYLSPAPEEIAASYSTYVIHPVDNKRCGYNGRESNAKSEVSDNSAQMSTLLKMFPIIVADSDQVEEEEEELQTEDIVADDNSEDNVWNIKFDNNENKARDEEWNFKEAPEIVEVDKEIADFFKEWFENEGPRATSPANWKRIKDRIDAIYEQKLQEYFGDDEKDDENDKYKDDWYDDTPFQYKYVDADDKWDYNEIYQKKSNPQSNTDYGYDWWRKQ